MARVASAPGIRVLLIKGPVLNAQRLRLPRDSQDVDVLVDPARFEEMLDGLAAIGWYPYFAHPTDMSWMPAHSVTLKHDTWPCALDVHHYFPGCLAPAQRVFDELWDRRSSVELGGRDLPCPDVLGSSVIAGLHALRAPDSWREKAELAHLTKVLDQRLGDAERADLAALAARMGAGETLRPLLESLGIHPDPGTPGVGTGGVGTGDVATPGSADELAAWHLRTASGRYPTLMRLEELRRTPWRRRPAALWRAVLLTEDEIRYNRPELPPGRWGLALGRLKRLPRVLPQIPRAAWYLAKSRGRR